MSSDQNPMHAVHEAVDDYSNDDASNIFLNLQDVHAGTKSIVLMTKTCYVEFDPMSPRAKLPACFARDVGSFIRGYVILQDPKGNRIQVTLERKDIRIYLARGWSRLRDFYGLGLGGWVTITYMSPLLFYIRVRKLSGQEVSYPERTPPHKLMLLDQSGGVCYGGPVPYFVTPTTFSHTLEKVLTSSDIESGFLTLNWSGFCERALPRANTQLTFIDWIGYTWKCHLAIGSYPRETCRVYGQWSGLCKARNLVEGVTIKLGVTKSRNNTVIHLKPSPFIGVRTTLVAPTTSGEFKAFYQVEHSYML
ncbi:hypothetical protein TSUD_04210 [Trifolium subterraneum]|nr:hypothetical protein TSUD_04210 [Trifolium subterraneum]